MADIYRFLTDVYQGVDAYAIYTASGMSEGDMTQWDYTARVATNALLVSGSIFLGVSFETNPMASLGTTARPLTSGRMRIQSQGVFMFKTTTGEVYNHTDPVYQGADAQTVSLLGSTRLIGRVHLPDGTQVTGAAGTSVSCRIFGSMTNLSCITSATTAAR